MSDPDDGSAGAAQGDSAGAAQDDSAGSGAAGTPERPADETPREGSDGEFSYEIAGGVLAGLGFVFTPLVTAAPAGYCALKVRESNPGACYGILALVAGTCLFWLIVVFAAELFAVLLSALSAGSLTLVLIGLPLVVLVVVVAGVAYLVWA
ncbi:MAG: hypothetical protein BRD21_07295 [Halobacteriales archaeon SW_8_66_22]|nr:MAG: hypothetical protein BRD21_07295 [Halobacteriales archaeon SW_8_66_22]